MRPTLEFIFALIFRTGTSLLDVAFLLPYAVIGMIWGNVVEEVHPRWILGIGLSVTSIAMLFFSYGTDLSALLVSLVAIGSSTSLTWPLLSHTTKIWYGQSKHSNLIFGVMGTSSFVGAVLATLSASALFSAYGWRWTYYIFGWLLIAISGCCTVLVRTPQDVSLSKRRSEEDLSAGLDSTEPSKRGIAETLLRPYVLHYGVVNFLVKMMRYFIYFWLPMFLEEQIRYTPAQAGYLSASYDLGGAMGPITLGLIIDRAFPGQFATVVALSVAGATIGLVLFAVFSSFGTFMCVCTLFTSGFFACGIDPIIGGSVPQETAGGLGVGLVGGFGTLGAIVEGPLAGVLSYAFGWNVTLIAFIALSSVALVAALHAARTNGVVKW